MTLQLLKKGKVWYYNGKVIVTDLLPSTKKDAVFPLCHENTYFAEHLATKKRDTVLDLCTGSGILAIFAAKQAEKVYAVDINPRALEFARLNAQLNSINNINFIKGDLFEAVRGIKFDLIIANPPFEPILLNTNYPIHSAGGEQGTDILQRILFEINNYVALNGSFQIITWIPKSKEYVLDKFDKKAYEKFKVEVLQNYSPQQVTRYLQKRLKRNIKFSESVSLVFIQALRKRCRRLYDIDLNPTKD